MHAASGSYRFGSITYRKESLCEEEDQRIIEWSVCPVRFGSVRSLCRFCAVRFAADPVRSGSWVHPVRSGSVCSVRFGSAAILLVLLCLCVCFSCGLRCSCFFVCFVFSSSYGIFVIIALCVFVLVSGCVVLFVLLSCCVLLRT